MSVKTLQDHTIESSFQVNLFGALTLLRDGQSMPSAGLAGTRPLLAYLLIHRHQPHARPALAGQLWPDLPKKRALHALSQSIWRIKSHLPGIFQANTHTIGVSPDAHLWIDVAEFEKLIGPHLANMCASEPSQVRTNLYQAIQYYRGDLLEGFYEDWVLNERRRLREMYLCALERLIQLEKLTGEHERALATAQTLVRAEPWHEAARREVMRLNCTLDRSDAALEHFVAYRQALEDELGLLPEAETIQLAQEIAARSKKVISAFLPAMPNSVAFLENTALGPLPLIGRREERAELAVWIENTCQGAIGIGLLEGEAGVGKTRLLQETERDAAWRGAQVLWGKGKELEATSPYGPLFEALNSVLSPLRVKQIFSLAFQGQNPHPGKTMWLQVLHPFLPALANELTDAQKSQPAPLHPAQEHIRLVEALAHLLLAWARVTPLVLILEDLHWVDHDTLDMLIGLAEQLPAWAGHEATSDSTTKNSGGILLIGSYRGEEARALPGVWERLQKLDRLGLYGRLSLQRLDSATTSELVTRSLGMRQPAPLFEARIYAETNGNPLFILETLRSLYEAGLLWRDEKGDWNTRFDESTTDYSELPLSPVVERLIASRLSQLPDELRNILNAAVVLGNRFDFSTLANMMNLDASTLLSGLNALMQRGLVGESTEEYYFQHDKVRQVVYENVPVDERTWLHRQAGQAIEQASPDQVDVLAYHWTLGEIWDRAVDYHQLAAKDAQAAHAHAAALEHFSAAIKLIHQTGSDEKLFDILAQRQITLDVLGERELQTADLEMMLQLAQGDPLRQAKVQCQRAEFLSSIGNYLEAETAARKALVLAQSCGSKSVQADALMALGIVFNRRGQPKRTIPYLRQAVEICRGGKDEHQRAKAHFALASTLVYQGEYPLARTEMELSLALYEKVRDRCGQVQALGTLGIASMEEGKLEAAVGYYSRALQIAREIGYLSEEGRVLANLGNMFWLKSETAHAQQHHEEAQRIFRALGNRRFESIARMNMAVMRHRLFGDSAAWVELQSGMAFFKEAGDSAQYDFLETLGDIARCRGDLKTARAYLEAGVAGAKDTSRWAVAVQSYSGLARVALDEGNPMMAWEYLDAAEAICEETGTTDSAIGLLDLRGQSLLALGRPQDALAATREAMAQLKPDMEQAYLIPFHHSKVLSALNQTTEAHAALEQAYQMLFEILSGLPPEMQKMSWQQVPEHRALLAAWQAIQPPLATIRLPRVDVPTGRPLRDDEWVEITWTSTEAGDEEIGSKLARRQHRLLRLLRQAKAQGAAPTVDDLAMALGTSVTTIKRDLATLRRSGQSVHTRGNRADKSW